MSQNLKFYNLITPNNDSVNEYWHIENIEEYPNNEVTIFNRSGQIIYQAKGYNNSSIRWDATWNGTRVLDSIYYYIVIAGDNEFNGDITVIH